MTGTIFATLSKFYEIGHLIANATPSAKNTPKTPGTPKTPKELRLKNVHYSTLQNRQIELAPIRQFQQKVMLNVDTNRRFNFDTTEGITEEEQLEI